MGHTRGGGIGNRAGSYDHTRQELIAEIRQRIADDELGTYADITEDELKRLVGETSSGRFGDWTPIAEAPIPPPEGLPIYWIYPCLIQTTTGDVVAGFARYVDSNARGVSPRVLRWYEGVSQRYAQILKPRYYQPMPQPRKD